MKGERTRHSILERAVDVASLEGLEGLTIGRLAEELSMSKSGLFAHFGSKEDLQIATIEAAQERFRVEVLRPAFAEPRGLPRLTALCLAFVGYVERRVFPGGCFFAGASFEFDGRRGAVREMIARAMDGWIETLETAITMARDEGHIDPHVDTKQLAFELNSIFMGLTFAFELLKDPEAPRLAAQAVTDRLERLRRDTANTAQPAKRRIAATGRSKRPNDRRA
jgi:AcrR family transcriptional regulator